MFPNCEGPAGDQLSSANICRAVKNIRDSQLHLGHRAWFHGMKLNMRGHLRNAEGVVNTGARVEHAVSESHQVPGLIPNSQST